MYKVMLAMLMLNFSLNGMEYGHHNDNNIIESKLRASYHNWPQIFQNKKYADYCRTQGNQMLKTIAPDAAVHLMVNGKFKYVPLRECVLTALMKPKSVPGWSFNEAFQHWQETVKKVEQGDVNAIWYATRIGR